MRRASRTDIVPLSGARHQLTTSYPRECDAQGGYVAVTLDREFSPEVARTPADVFERRAADDTVEHSFFRNHGGYKRNLTPMTWRTNRVPSSRFLNSHRFRDR